MSNNTSQADNSSRPDDFLPAPTFNDFALMKTVVLGVIAVVSLFGNLVTLLIIRRNKTRTTSTVYQLIAHLAFADVLVSLFCATTEAIWTYTVQWYAGVAMCKLVKCLQMFSLYLSTFILVLISLDRYVAVKYPMSRTNARRNCNLIIVAIWMFSVALSMPQMFIFDVRQGPFLEVFYQCVTYEGIYTAKWQEQFYTTCTLLFMFVLPLIILITAYICTFRTISKSEESFRGEATETHCGIIRRKLLRKAKTKSLELTVVIVLAFIICWTPYYVFMIVHIFLDPSENENIDAIQSPIFFFGLSNSMINPLIYGAFHLHKTRRRSSLGRHVSQSTFTTGSSFRKTHILGRNDDPPFVTIVEDFDGGPMRDSVKQRPMGNKMAPNHQHTNGRDNLKTKCTSF